jgi:aryl-alcohol dehydrogenase-like predicted oxidoreductase
MNTPHLSSGHPVGLGTFAFTGQLSPVARGRPVDVVDAYVGEGGYFLETAPRYASPAFDLGRVLKRYRRDDLVLATKCVARTPDGSDGYANALAQFEAESARLDVDYIDVVQVRVLDLQEDVAGALHALADLRRAGRVRWIGLSRVSSSAAVARLAEKVDIDLLQNRLSVLRRTEHGPELVRCCQRLGIGLNPCQVLERGQLCETTADPADRSAVDIRRFKAQYNGLFHRLVRNWVEQRFTPLARDCGLSTEQLSLGWALSQPGVSLCVVGASRPEQIRLAMAAPRRLPVDIAERVEAEILAFQRDVRVRL